MKIVGIIFSLLITLISAALFRGFPRGVLSVHHSFGKLMSDVVSNVRQNIDCSIQSMQGILDKGKPIPYTSNSRCNELANQRVIHTNSIQNVETATPSPIKVNKFTNGGNMQDTPRSAVNKTLLDIIKKQSTQRKLGEINKVLRNESEQLNNVNVLLKQKIDTISKDVSEELKNIERDHKDPPMEEVIHEIELIREHKKNDSLNVDEVHEIAKDVLNVLNTNDTTSKVTTSLEAEELKQIVTDFERYSNNTLKEIEKEFKDWEIIESNQLSSIKNILQRQQVTSRIQNRTDDKTRSFKGIVKNILDGKSVYSNHTSGENIENGAEFINKSETVKYESIVTSTENLVTHNPVSLSMNQVSSNIANKGKLNNLFNTLQNESDSKEIDTISEKSISTHNDSRSDKNSEIIISSTEKSGKLDLSSTETNVHLQNDLSADYINSNLNTGVEIIAMNLTDLSDEGKYMRSKNTLSMNKIVRTNDSDNVTESIKVLVNISGIPGNVSRVEKHLVTENFIQITPIDIRSMPTNISLNSGNLSNVSNEVHLASNESLPFTIQNNLNNDIDVTTEYSYKSTNIDNILSNTPYLSSMVNIVNADNAGFLNKLNSSVNIDRETESTNTSTIKSDITDYNRIEQPVTIESILSSDHDDENKTEPINTIINTDDTSTMLNFENIVTTENSFSTNKINLTEITDNETKPIVTSTTIGKIPDVVTTENKNTTVMINKMYNSSPTFTESMHTSTNTYHNLVHTPTELYPENLVTTENYYSDAIDSNYQSVEKTKSIRNISINENITHDISSVEIHITTANFEDANYMKPSDDSIERTESIETSTSTYNIIDLPNLNNLVTTETYIVSKLNSNNNYKPVLRSTSSITDGIPGIISSESQASATQIISSHDIENLTQASATSMDTDITTVLTTENARKIDCFDKKSKCIISSTNIDDISEMSSLGSQMTTEYFIGSNQRNDDIETSTGFSVAYTSINTDDGLIGTTYVSNVNRFVTTESPILSNKLNSTTIHSTNTDDTPDIIAREKLVLSTQIYSKRVIENITESNLASTNVEDLEHNTLNIEENVTTDNSRINTNGYFNKGTDRISASTNIDDISNVLNVGSQMSTEYRSNVDIETSTDFSTISAHTNDSLADASDVPCINTPVTTEHYFNSKIYSNDDKIEENESIVTSTYISNTLDVSREENLITTEILVPTSFVDSYNNISEETEPNDTSTNIGDIINVSSVEESFTLERPYAMSKINSNNAKFLHTSSNTDLLDTSTNISSSTNYSNDEIDKETDYFDNISDMLSEHNLDSTEYSLTTKQNNAYFNTPTETSNVPNINILVTTDNYHTADNIYSNVDTVEDSESMGTSTYNGDIIDVSSVSEEFLTSIKPHTIDEINFNNSIYKNSKSIQRPTTTDSLDTLSFEEIVSNKNSSSTISSNDDIESETEFIDPSAWTRNEFIGASTRIDDSSIDVSSEEKLDTVEEVISKNHAELYDDIAEKHDTIDASTYKVDIFDVSDEKEGLTTEKPYTTTDILSNYDPNEETDSIESDSGEALDESYMKKFETSYPISAKPINLKIDKHTESIDTSAQTDWASSVEQMAPTKHTLSTKQIITKLDTNTESIDILPDSDDQPNVSSLENFVPIKNNPLIQLKKQSPSFVSSSEDLKVLSKGKTREQAVKLALNIFEQSKRSQMIMKNVFKNEKHARNLF